MSSSHLIRIDLGEACPISLAMPQDERTYSALGAITSLKLQTPKLPFPLINCFDILRDYTGRPAGVRNRDADVKKGDLSVASRTYEAEKYKEGNYSISPNLFIK